MDSDQEKRMTEYLLGQLSEQDQIELERGYLADDTLFEELLAIEDDLRDAYVRGELSQPDREAFEKRLLSAPDQKQKQQFARTLRLYLNESSSKDRPIPWLLAHCKSLFRTLGTRRLVLIPALSIALVFLIAGSWWLGHRGLQPLQSRNAPSAGAPVGTHEAPAGGSASSQELQTKTVALVLTAGSVRGSEGESNTLMIPPDVSRIRLEARFKGDYSRYQAVVETAEGKRIWEEGNLLPHAFPGGERVFFYLSSKLLLPDDYILTLRGLPVGGSPETVAEYSFRVRKG